VLAASLVADHRTSVVVKVWSLAFAQVAAVHGDSAAYRDVVAGVVVAVLAPSCPGTWDENPAVGSPSSRVVDVVVVEVAAEGVVDVDSVDVAGTDTCLRSARCRCWAAGPGDMVAGHH